MCGVPRVQPHMSRLLATALSLVVLLGACGEPGSEGEGELGTIQGVVLLGPVCPVETETSPCPDEPLSGVEVVAVDQDGNETTAVSGSDGRFSHGREPGRVHAPRSGRPGRDPLFEAGRRHRRTGPDRRGRPCRSTRASGRSGTAQADPAATIAKGSGRRETRGPRAVSAASPTRKEPTAGCRPRVFVPAADPWTGGLHPDRPHGHLALPPVREPRERAAGSDVQRVRGGGRAGRREVRHVFLGGRQ